MTLMARQEHLSAKAWREIGRHRYAAITPLCNESGRGGAVKR
jgi:hypothetical protein